MYRPAKVPHVFRCSEAGWASIEFGGGEWSRGIHLCSMCRSAIVVTGFFRMSWMPYLPHRDERNGVFIAAMHI